MRPIKETKKLFAPSFPTRWNDLSAEREKTTGRIVPPLGLRSFRLALIRVFLAQQNCFNDAREPIGARSHHQLTTSYYPAATVCSREELRRLFGRAKKFAPYPLVEGFWSGLKRVFSFNRVQSSIVLAQIKFIISSTIIIIFSYNKYF